MRGGIGNIAGGLNNLGSYGWNATKHAAHSAWDGTKNLFKHHK
jgi:hypothetical protein